eukprot:CAMPEP_0119389198 /NCGR_PEP_ID=MMETSP1334-20130426/108203_1 /TAXON_ID=127549 /ORGANISM="Calcidiscus leptoporus, Strain RCC1130" /LENGTH=149 /DNA_ID=CAMNT_0007411389 /DNA_START=203 /DNA_END=653 /DNA_ORIENTATION=+
MAACGCGCGAKMDEEATQVDYGKGGALFAVSEVARSPPQADAADRVLRHDGPPMTAVLTHKRSRLRCVQDRVQRRGAVRHREQRPMPFVAMMPSVGQLIFNSCGEPLGHAVLPSANGGRSYALVLVTGAQMQRDTNASSLGGKVLQIPF